MQTTKQIKAGWNPGERDTAHCHLYNYGVIFLDGLGKAGPEHPRNRKTVPAVCREARPNNKPSGRRKIMYKYTVNRILIAI